MTKIRVLDPDTVNQIAAGEVVERPASVVKELLENAIDAGGSTSILLDVSSDMAGGITKIRVTDNGEGMSGGEEAALAFHPPHATSKIREIADLSAIRTLGFRGEALASIAAVAEVTLVTRPRGGGGERSPGRGSSSGGAARLWRKARWEHRRGGRQSRWNAFSTTPPPVGSSSKAGTPSSPTSTRSQKVSPLPTARSPSGWCRTARSGWRPSDREGGLNHHRGGALRRRTRQVARPGRGKAPVPPYRRLHLPAVGEPGGNPSQISVSINGRSISSRQIAAAVREGYGTLLPKDRYPVAFLELSIDTGLVDVNVHPTKREVRLSREREITGGAIAAAVEEALTKHDLTRETPPDEPVQQQIVPGGAEPVPSPPPVAESGASYTAGHRSFTLSDRQLRRTETEGGENLLPAMEPIGQVAATYIVAEGGSDGTLYLIDQHAAHERILYDQVSEQRDRAAGSQELITPVVVSLPPEGVRCAP